MSAPGAQHLAWRRRWASLPVVVALLFATSVAGAGVRAGSATVPLTLPAAVQGVTAPAQPTAGHRPEFLTGARGGPGAPAPDPAAAGWLPARTGTAFASWWLRRPDADRHRAHARLETYQSRGPPGRRAADVPS